MIKVGEINKMKVKRITDIAFVLTSDGEDEIFLHKKEATELLQENDLVNVFVYLDSKRRLTATMNKPLIFSSKPAFLEVRSYKPDLGWFLFDGMPKDLLLSKDDVLFSLEQAPKEGDTIFVSLKATEREFRAKIPPKELFYDCLHPSGQLQIGNWVKAYIQIIHPLGLTCYTKDGYEVWIPNAMYRGKKRIGEEVTCQIVRLNRDNVRKYEASLLKPIESQLDDDAKKILDYLKINKETNLTDKSDPLRIYQAFQLSKAAYKRALGRLYKGRFIKISDDKVELVLKR